MRLEYTQFIVVGGEALAVFPLAPSIPGGIKCAHQASDGAIMFGHIDKHTAAGAPRADLRSRRSLIWALEMRGGIMPRPSQWHA